MKRIFPLFQSIGMYALAALAITGITTESVQAERVRLSIQSTGGQTFFTPFFAGFHDNDFNLTNATGSGTLGVASPGLKTLAELGMTGGLASEFQAGGSNRVSGTLAGTPPGPGAPPLIGPVGSPFDNVVTQEFDVNINANSRLTLAAMLLPSSDFFIGNISQAPFDISSLSIGETLTFSLSALYDAGTELNDFNTSPGTPLLPGLPAGDATLNVADPNTSIRLVTGNIFSDTIGAPVGFNPTLSSITVTVSAVPEPTAGLAGCVALGGLAMRRRRKKSC